MTKRTARAPASLPVDVTQGPSGQLVTVHGRIDASVIAGLRDRLQQAIDTGSGDVVLLLGDAEIGDATGLGLLVGAHHRARRAGRRLVVSEVSERTARLLRASRLDRVLGQTGREASAQRENARPAIATPVGAPVAPLTAYLRH